MTNQLIAKQVALELLKTLKEVFGFMSSDGKKNNLGASAKTLERQVESTKPEDWMDLPDGILDRYETMVREAQDTTAAIKKDKRFLKGL